MQETIQKSLNTGVCEERTLEEARSSQHVSLEFIVTKSDGKMRSVAGFSHLSTYWDRKAKKLSTLKFFAVLI